MIQILEILPNGAGRSARLGCSCGQESLAQSASVHGKIIYCAHCGELTAPDRLRGSIPGARASDLEFSSLPDGLTPPLVSVALPIHCHWDGLPEPVSGTVTKLSPHKLIVRLASGIVASRDAQRAGVVWKLSCLDPSMEGALIARFNQALQPQSAAGTTYYELSLDELDPSLRSIMTEYYYRQCAGVEDDSCSVNFETRPPRHASPGDTQTLFTQAARLTTEAIHRLCDTGSTLQRPDSAFSVEAEEFVRVLCMASESHDANSSNHLKRIAAYSAAIARELGWTNRRVAMMATASKLHDVGKLGVPDVILKKPGALTVDERRTMQQHTRFGWQILHGSGSEVIRLGAVIALRHHERFDGQGYPDGLASELIPQEAQIVSIVDVFDALTSARAYKPAWSNEQARTYINEQSGKMFRPDLVTAFERVWPEIEQNQLRFLDDFRDIWTERRKQPRMQTDTIPLQIEIAVPVQTFRPLKLTGFLMNVSAGGLKARVQGVTNDLFSIFVTSRRYAKITFPAIIGDEHEGSFCSVVWMDFYALPDPDACLMGLEFQKISPEHTAFLNDLRNSLGALL